MSRHGENIRKRSDGRWEARLIERYENGKAKYRYLYAKTYAEVKAKKVACLKESAPKPHNVKSLVTLSELSAQWLSYVKTTVKESTYTRYHRSIHKYILPHIGNIRLEKLDASSLNSFVAQLLSCGGKDGGALSAKTVSDMLCILKLCLTYGKDNGYPCPDLDKVKQPKGKQKEITVVKKDDREKLFEVLFDSTDKLSLGILLSLTLGLRVGEVCALRWRDIDLKGQRLNIPGTIERIADTDPVSKQKTKVVYSAPKTATSERVLPLPRILVDHLKSHDRVPEHYILTDSTTPSEPHTLYIRFKRFLKRNGLGDYTFHALRHTFATSCAENGFDPKMLSEILGHKNVQTTLSLYVHPSFEAKLRQMDALLCRADRGQKCSLPNETYM